MSHVSWNSEEAARDILAAEAFAVPAADPGLRRGLVLPDDPAGIAEPHDILAAEEFAMPAPEPPGSPAGRMRTAARLPGWIQMIGVGLAGVLVRRRRRP